MEKQTIRFRPMIVSVVFTLFSLFSILTICPNTVFAADPTGVTVEYYSSSSFIYANGNAITLKAGSDPDKTLIYLDSDPANPVELTGLEAYGNTTDGYNLAGCSIYGGCMAENVPTSKVTMEGGKIFTLYGGGRDGDVPAGTNVTIAGGSVAAHIYGSGHSANAPTGSTHVTVTGGTVAGSVYGGGMDAPVGGNTMITMSGNAIVQGGIYGGGGSGSSVSGNTTVTVSGGEAREICGAGKGGNVGGSTTVMMSGGTVKGVIYGGSSSSGTVTGIANIILTGGTVDLYASSTNGGFVYGGGNGAVGGTNIAISGSAYVKSYICGGGGGTVNGDINLTINGGTFGGNIYGGGSGSLGAVTGNTNLTINGGTLDKNIYGGGSTAAVTGTATVKIGADASITGIVTEGGRDSTATVGAGSHVEYEVAFYDGTTKLASPAPQWITAGSTVVQPASNPVSPGKAFNGWNKADNSAFDFSAAITAAAKVYADWTSLPTYAITYNGNGNTGANVPLAGNTGNLTKTGFTFGGWSTTANGTAVTTYTMGSAPVTFYAVWKTTPADNGNNNNSSNNNSSSTTTTSRAPSLETGGGQTIVGALEAAKSGTTVEVNMNDSTMLQGDWLKAVAGRDVNLVLDMGGSIKWTINGKNVSGTSFSDVNLGVSTSTSRIPGSVVNKVSGERKTVQFTITHNGSFGFTAALSVDLGKENKGLFANLYYYNETTQKMEFQSASKIGEDGSAAWEFKHASSYAVVIDKVSYATELSAGAAIKDTATALK